MDSEYSITNIKEEATGAHYGAVVNGTYRSGFCEDSRGENGRIYQAIQEAIINGEPVEPFVPFAPSILQLLVETDAELVKIAARTIEDIIQERIDGGGFVAQPVKDKISERITLRAQL